MSRSKRGMDWSGFRVGLSMGEWVDDEVQTRTAWIDVPQLELTLSRRIL